MRVHDCLVISTPGTNDPRRRSHFLVTSVLSNLVVQHLSHHGYPKSSGGRDQAVFWFAIGGNMKNTQENVISILLNRHRTW